jgi:hypothetical protein
MAYADYQYYLQTYFGNAISEADFPRLSVRASEYLDRVTRGRAVADIDNTTAIKKAMCAVAEEMQSVESDGGLDGIASESIGSSSVTYADNSARRMVKERRYERQAAFYLGGTGLMFAGFSSDEYGGGGAD